ncbi:hypothetical protein LRY64_00190 [Candidatus Woesebacteria bacterium]|nr:hypothetical protein [Candidatus Woesebacteria bacterium]
MQVLLLRNVKSVGKAGDIVTVKPGYATNYLFPKNMATPDLNTKVDVKSVSLSKKDSQKLLKQVTKKNSCYDTKCK